MANKTVSWGNFQTSTPAGTLFPDEITVQVQDGFDPAPGVTLTIAAQQGSGGSSGTFSNGLSSIDVTTDAVGFASAGDLRANDIPGGFTLTANGFLSGVIDPAPKSMTVDAPTGVPVASSMGNKTGDFQQSSPSSALASPFTVTVRDQYGAPFAGQSVTFTAPAGTGTFAGSGTNSITVISDGSGVASSGIFTRSASTPPFQVNATSSGLPTQTFTVNNAAPEGIVSIGEEYDASSNVGPANIAAPGSRTIGSLLQVVLICTSIPVVAGWTNFNGAGSSQSRWRVYWRIADGTAADNFSANVGNTLWYCLMTNYVGGVYDPTAPLQDWVSGSNTTVQTTVTNVAGITGYLGNCLSVGSGTGGTVGNSISGTGWGAWRSYDAYTVGAWMTFVSGKRTSLNANQATLRPFSASGGGTSVAGAAWNIKPPSAAPVAAAKSGPLQFCEV